MDLGFADLEHNERMIAEGKKFAEKLRGNPTTYKKWVDATFPEMVDFFHKCCPEHDVKIVVFNEASTVLQTIEPYGNGKTVIDLKLVRSDDYRFRLTSSSSFETASGLMTLFECLRTFLKENGWPQPPAPQLINMFDVFTRSQIYCPGLGETVKEILGEKTSQEWRLPVRQPFDPRPC